MFNGLMRCNYGQLSILAVATLNWQWSSNSIMEE